MQIHNAVITGSFSYNGADLSNVTSSNQSSASLSSRTTNLESTSSVLVGASSSFSSILTSVSSSQQQISSSYIALSASYNTFSGSASTRITVDSASLLQVSSSQQQISSSLLQVSASYTALSGSYNTFSGSASTRVTQIENVYATTGSNSFRATQSITGSLTVTGQITAQTLNVQQVTSSIVYSSGSNVFGCDLNSRQTFTGSVLITGSLTIAAGGNASAPTIFGSTIACSPIGCFATSCATAFIGGTMSGTTIYGSTAVCTPSILSSGTICSTGNTCFGGMSIITSCLGVGTASPAYLLDVNGTGRFTGALSGTSATFNGTFTAQSSTTVNAYIISTGGDYDTNLYLGYGGVPTQTYIKRIASSLVFGTTNVNRLTIGYDGAATFSSTITANGGNILSSGSSYGIVQVKGSGASTWQMFANPSDEMRFGRSGVGDYLTIANTGAATFACSVQVCTNISAGTYLGVSRNGSDTIGSGPYLVLSQTTNSRQWIQQMGASLSLDFYHYNGSAWIQPLILAASGDITITCNVRVGGVLTIAGDTNGYQIKSSDYNFSGGLREMFRVSHIGLTTSGRFTLNGTGNSFVHSSQWAWSSTHNGGTGRGRIVQLTGGEYSDIQFVLDTTTSGDIIISANFGTSYTLNLFIEKVRGGAIDTSNQNADRTSPASGYSRVQTITSTPYGSQFYRVVAETLAGSGNRAVYSDGGGSLTNSSSDVTLKKNVENITYGLNSIMALRPISFNWIPENLGEQKEIGFIAQEVQELIPEVIGINNNETLSLDYPKLTAVLVKAIQEQQCTICSQASMINILKTCLGIA